MSDHIETNSIQAAIANEGGLPLVHMPELLTFCAVLRIGQYDTQTENVFDGPAALSDFEEAILFADSAAKPILQGQLAVARFALQDC